MMIASMRMRWSSALGIVLPSTKPIIVTLTVHSAAPTMLKIVNSRTGISATPAIGLAKVRTIGMKRARTIVFGPYWSK